MYLTDRQCVNYILNTSNLLLSGETFSRAIPAPRHHLLRNFSVADLPDRKSCKHRREFNFQSARRTCCQSLTVAYFSQEKVQSVQCDTFEARIASLEI